DISNTAQLHHDRMCGSTRLHGTPGKTPLSFCSMLTILGEQLAQRAGFTVRHGGIDAGPVRQYALYRAMQTLAKDFSVMHDQASIGTLLSFEKCTVRLLSQTQNQKLCCLSDSRTRCWRCETKLTQGKRAFQRFPFGKIIQLRGA